MLPRWMLRSHAIFHFRCKTRPKTLILSSLVKDLPSFMIRYFLATIQNLICQSQTMSNKQKLDWALDYMSYLRTPIAFISYDVTASLPPSHQSELFQGLALWPPHKAFDHPWLIYCTRNDPQMSDNKTSDSSMLGNRLFGQVGIWHSKCNIIYASKQLFMMALSLLCLPISQTDCISFYACNRLMENAVNVLKETWIHDVHCTSIWADYLGLDWGHCAKAMCIVYNNCKLLMKQHKM